VLKLDSAVFVQLRVILPKQTHGESDSHGRQYGTVMQQIRHIISQTHLGEAQGVPDSTGLSVSTD